MQPQKTPYRPERLLIGEPHLGQVGLIKLVVCLCDVGVLTGLLIEVCGARAKLCGRLDGWENELV